MSSLAIRPRSRPSPLAAVIGSAVVLLATLGASSSRAQGVGPEADPGAVATAPGSGRGNPFAESFPDLVLKTHEGKTVRFYENLLKGKIVLINFMYATCEER
jgi:protein SCO1/2